MTRTDKQINTERLPGIEQQIREGMSDADCLEFAAGWLHEQATRFELSYEMWKALFRAAHLMLEDNEAS